jgi:hypothetical protein
LTAGGLAMRASPILHADQPLANSRKCRSKSAQALQKFVDATRMPAFAASNEGRVGDVSISGDDAIVVVAELLS